METNETKKIELTAEEMAEFEAFKVEKAKQAQVEKAKQDREAYRALVDEAISESLPELLGASEALRDVKDTVFKRFEAVLGMKANVFGTRRDNQRTDSFTNADSSARIILGVHTTDGYDDTVEDGIQLVRDYLESLAGDARTRDLVAMVLQLLARDAKGTLKASRVLQLRKIAEKSGDEKFLDGVRIIEEAYRPAISRRFIRAEVKDAIGAWVSVPLGMTEV